MSYTGIMAGLHTVFETVAGIDLVLDFVPRGISVTPLLYSLATDGQLQDAGTAATSDYVPHHRIQHRLVLSWQDNEQCETELAAFIDAIPQALKADPTLGGAIHDGEARITNYEAGWMESPPNSGITYRVCDFYSEVWEV